jgi:regulator of protease activity HflC (stomatin/prohibitin superfamily)
MMLPRPNSAVLSSPITPFKLGCYVVIAIVLLWGLFNVIENLNANQIMCIQSPLSGKLTFFTDAGPKYQGFGKVTKYDKRSIYKFEHIIRFNDNGHGTVFGSIQFDIPMDKENLYKIQTKYGSEDALKDQLLQTVVNKCLYMTGPMMSSRESAAEKRAYLINYVEDQVANGVYKTVAKEVTVKDPISGSEKAVTVVEIVFGKDGLPGRQEEAILKNFGIRAFNFSIDNLKYDKTVEDQIAEQQKIMMAVQTAMADAKKAEQAAITAEANGKASAMSAKWAQEAIKASAVTIAEKNRDSMKLVAEAAAFEKQALILQGQGESEKRRLILNADGALAIKIEAWKSVQSMWADAFSKFQGSIVPQIVSGGSGYSNGQNGANQFMEMMGMKAAKDLGLELAIPRGATK